ncbi:MSC_0882 family membrane protein [Spiroplasma endosymbiont of Crioceris asparagi]|uniref:MSC_0882 family membrane protein n=1 Tax=Spiroplasma endosymbiont of Crioceris asparagi TaxID=3066286 RepID=UPI0030CF0AC0
MKILNNILRDKNQQPQSDVASFSFNQQGLLPTDQQQVIQQPIVQQPIAQQPVFNSLAYQNNLVQNLQKNKYYYKPRNQRTTKSREQKIQAGYEQKDLDFYIEQQPKQLIEKELPVKNISKSLFEEYDYVPEYNNFNNFSNFKGFDAKPQNPQNEYGFNVNNIQIQNQQFYNQQQEYIEPQDFNEFDGAYQKIEKKDYINIEIPLQIGREIRAEKMRLFLWLVVGSVGLIFSALMLVGYYRTWQQGEIWLGFKKADVVYPVFTIPLTIISIGVILMSLFDFSFLFANVRKYQIGIFSGNETIPYFITKNYRAFIKREVYVTWLAFSIYFIGSIILMILYGMQSRYEAGSDVYFFFWKLGSLKSFSTEIAINIAILIGTLVGHVGNIVWTKMRKNNIISYYGYEILPSEEIRYIKKRTNRICLITWLIIIAVLLFIIVIPWLLLRRKRGLPFNPIGRN